MISRIRTAAAVALPALVLVGLMTSSAQASVLSLLPGYCPSQPASQPFSQWGDSSSYTLVPGGSFEAGSVPWVLTGGAATVAGNESFNVGGGSQSLSLPADSSAVSPVSCTSLAHPTVRFFLRNTGSPASRLTVQALYPTLLGGVGRMTIGQVSGSATWTPAAAEALLVSNLLATVSLDQTTVAFTFAPADDIGAWSIDDVYLDPYRRS